MSAVRLLAEIVGWLVIITGAMGAVGILDFHLSITSVAKPEPEPRDPSNQEPNNG